MSHERRQYAGGAPATTLSGAISNTATSIPLTSGTGYPDGSVGPFFIVVDPGLATEEKIKCTSRSVNTITCTLGNRGADGTSAYAHASGAAVEHIWTAVDADESNSHYADTTLDHHTQYQNTARHAAVSHLIGTHLPAPAAPANVTKAAADAGASTSSSRADHKHDVTTAVASLFGVNDSAVEGTATSLSRSDHKHAGPGFAVPTDSRPGDATAIGAELTIARSDHKHSRESAASGQLVSTNQSRASSSFGDLATVGPTATLDTHTLALVILQATMTSTTAGETALMGYEVSGATTLAASAASALSWTSAGSGYQISACAAFLTVLGAGSNVFKAKYASSAGNSCSWSYRGIIVIPLN